MGRRARAKADLDTELTELPPDLRWREWMGRVEAVIFASPAPVTRETLARVVGRDCNLDLIIDDIRAELRGRPYELVSVAGGWQHRTRKIFGDAIRAAIGGESDGKALSQSETLILACIAYYQPITRSELSAFFGKEVSRDTIGRLRGLDLIASGPRSPQPGAPYTYVTTRVFWCSSVWRRCAICRTWRRWRTPACSARTRCWRESFQIPCRQMIKINTMTKKLQIGQRQASRIWPMGLPIIHASAMGFWSASAELREKPREAEVLAGSAKARRSSSCSTSSAGRVVVNGHGGLAESRRAVAQGAYLEGNGGEYIIPNNTIYRRESKFYRGMSRLTRMARRSGTRPSSTQPAFRGACRPWCSLSTQSRAAACSRSQS